MRTTLKILLTSVILFSIICLFNFNRDGSKYNKHYIATTYKSTVVYKQHYTFNETIIKKLNNILSDIRHNNYTAEGSNEIPNIEDLDNYAKYDVFWVFTKKNQKDESYILIYITEGIEIINDKQFKIYVINKTEF